MIQIVHYQYVSFLEQLFILLLSAFLFIFLFFFLHLLSFVFVRFFFLLNLRIINFCHNHTMDICHSSEMTNYETVLCTGNFPLRDLWEADLHHRRRF